jgi:hypothetical protein
VEFNPVKPRRLRSRRAAPEALDEGRDLVDEDLAMRRDRHPTVPRQRLTFEGNHGRRNRGGPIAEVDMRLAAIVGDLHDDGAALIVNGIRDAAPALNVSVGVDAGRPEVAPTIM